MSEHLLQKIAAAIGLGLLCLVGVSLANGAPSGDPPPGSRVPGGWRINGSEQLRNWDGIPPAASTRDMGRHTLFQTSTINPLLEGVRDGDLPVAAAGAGQTQNETPTVPLDLSTALPLRAAERHTLFQTSTINALLEGVYDGDLPVAALRQHGDFGLGTLNGLDGEMVQVDGQVFQVRSDGKARLVPDDTGVPFAETTFFDADRNVTLERPLSFKEMTTYIDTLLPSRNTFYAVRIEGTFAYVKTRSVPRQVKPYPRLAEVVKTQRTFEFHHQRGVMVGFWMPDYAAGLNVPGYHFHFLTTDRTGGGHVLDCTLGQVRISVEETPRFSLDLPRTPEFRAAVLDTDRRREVSKVEK